MNDSEREQVLKRVITTSAFVCALCILPITQHYLTQQTSPETGEVQGVSTDAHVFQSIATNPGQSNELCGDQGEETSVALERYANAKKQAAVQEYENDIKPYQESLAHLEGDPSIIQEQAVSINQAIQARYQHYLDELNTIQSTLESQKKERESRSCAAE